MSHSMKTLIYIISFLLFISWGLYIYLSSMTPSLTKNWEEDQKVLTNISFSGTTITMKDIRNFRYKSTDSFEKWYYDSKYDVAQVTSVDYIIEPFGDIDGFAHTMLSFWFDDGKYISVSAEIRKEVWESFHPVLWLLNKYEIVYIVWDEEDLIKLRANYRKDQVILYPIKADKKDIEKLFLSVMQRAQSLSQTPEFYNTLTKTCTTSILSHVNSLRAEYQATPIEWGKKVFLPSHSDEIAYDLWLINTDLTLSEAREYYTINELSEQHQAWENYSKMIRKEIR